MLFGGGLLVPHMPITQIVNLSTLRSALSDLTAR